MPSTSGLTSFFRKLPCYFMLVLYTCMIYLSILKIYFVKFIIKCFVSVSVVDIHTLLNLLSVDVFRKIYMYKCTLSVESSAENHYMYLEFWDALLLKLFGATISLFYLTCLHLKFFLTYLVWNPLIILLNMLILNPNCFIIPCVYFSIPIYIFGQNDSNLFTSLSLVNSLFNVIH